MRLPSAQEIMRAIVLTGIYFSSGRDDARVGMGNEEPSWPRPRRSGCHPKKVPDMISVAGAGPAFFPPVDRPIPSDQIALISHLQFARAKSRIG